MSTHSHHPTRFTVDELLVLAKVIRAFLLDGLLAVALVRAILAVVTPRKKSRRRK